MALSPTKLNKRTFIRLTIAVLGVACLLAAKQTLTAEDDTPTSSSAVVRVTIAVPDGELLTGTAVVILEDITVQDAPALELARVRAQASSLSALSPTVTVPIDVNLIDPTMMINASVLIDSDDDGVVSAGDWLSDALVPVITNSVMSVQIEVKKI